MPGPVLFRYDFGLTTLSATLPAFIVACAFVHLSSSNCPALLSSAFLRLHPVAISVHQVSRRRIWSGHDQPMRPLP